MRFTAALFLAVSFAAATPGLAQNSDSNAKVTAFVEISRPHVYANEMFDMTLVVESKGVLLAQDMQLEPGPEKDRLLTGGFVALPEEKSISNRKVFLRRRFRCSARVKKPGELVIAPTLLVMERQRVQGFWGPTWREKPQRVEAKPYRLLVKPVPHRPTNWSTAIGQFKLDVTPTPTVVSPGDLITLRTEIRGMGYMEQMTPPNVTTATHFKTYKPKLVTETSDFRAFSQVIIPQSTNAAAVPPVIFCFFDPIKETFVTLDRGPFPLTFQKKTIATGDQFTPEEDIGVQPKSVSRDSREPVRRGALAFVLGLAVLCATAASINIVRKRRGRALLWGVGVLVCGAVFWGIHVSQIWNPQVLCIQRDTAARIAPSPSALVCAELSEGAEITISEQHGAWVRVRHQDIAGWIPENTISPE